MTKISEINMEDSNRFGFISGKLEYKYNKWCRDWASGNSDKSNLVTNPLIKQPRF